MLEYPQNIQCGEFMLEKIDPTFDNARRIFEIVDKERGFLAEFLDWIDVSNRPEDMYVHMYNVSKTDNGSYYIIYQGNIVGSVGVGISSKKHKIAEISYWLSKEYNGRGIMTRSVKAIEKFAFENLDVNRIEIIMDITNSRSESVAQRAGYVKEGTRRQSYMFRRQLRDVFVYSKLKSEWEKDRHNA